MVDSTNNKELEKEEYSREKALEVLSSLDMETVVYGLLGIVFCDSDWRWVQQICLEYSNSSDENIRGIALLCFGHIARFHRKLDVEVIKPVLLNALKDESAFVRGHAGDALSDIKMFVPARKTKRKSRS